MGDVKKRRNKRRQYNVKDVDEIEIIDDIEEIEVLTDEGNVSENKKKNKLQKGEKLFLIINIFIILSLIIYYGYRTVYYYKREHKKEDKITLKEKITNISNITYKDDGLYEKDNYFYYKGKNVNNYVYYSGRMFRIISIDDNIKVIEDNVSSNLVYGLNKKYDESIIYKWLNNYLKTYKDYDMYLTENNWCNNSVDINNYSCNDDLNSFIGLISTEEYIKAGGVSSYLNNNEYFWTINFDDNSPYFVNNSGNINNYIKDDNNYFSYGIRPVITIRGNVEYLSGDGSKENPYLIDNSNAALLNDSSVGNYVKYNDYLFRIIDIKENDVTLILNDSIDVEKKYKDSINYLNNEFIKKFNKDDLVKQELITNIYNYSNNYDYEKEIKKEDLYITIPKIGDLFINNSNNYWLSTISDEKINTHYIIDENNMYFGDLEDKLYKIRPIIKLKGDIIIKEGNGMIDTPLIIG